MSARLAGCVFLAMLAGCARNDATSDAVSTLAANGAQAPGATAIKARPQLAPRAAALPDRGEFAAYAPSATVRHDGAYTWFRADVSEAHALRAIADGHLRLTTPEGQLLDVRYDRRVEHPSGDWTWIGHLPGEPGAQTIITFGEKAVFGSIAQPGKPPLRLTSHDGVSWLVETDPRKLATIVNAATRPTKPDFHVVPRSAASHDGGMTAAAARASAATATTSGPVIVDLLVGYTGGLVSRLGSVSAVNTRLNYLVDVANAAYANSQVNAQVRLVHSMQVDYPDNNTNDIALAALSGKTSDGFPGTVDSRFNALRSAREQYGADLVSLVRPFLDPEQDSCGLAWLIGGGLEGVNLPTGSDTYAYSVVGDGEDVNENDQKTYYCRDETLAHEMGHNEGSAHDRTTAQGDDGTLDNPSDYGAFTYSFGYRNPVSVTVSGHTYSGFYTVMAYGDSTTYQYGYRVFSNPRITLCGGHACGTTSSEDNARSLGQMIPLIAAFRATAVNASPDITWFVAGVGDFNNDGRSDILWRNSRTGANAIWRSGDVATPQAVTAVTTLTWKIVGVGDFNGDGKDDILWRNASTGADTIWLSGNSATQQAMAAVTVLTWSVAGVGDFDGDGKDDVLWRNGSTGANAIWRSGNASTPLSIAAVTNTEWKIAKVADFNGDGRDDILWRNTTTGANAIWRSGNAGTPQAITAVTVTSWAVAGAGDFSGDGVADVLWRNSTTGANAIWKSANSGAPQAISAVGNTDWIVAGVGDFSGDGQADILWRNTATGADAIWKSADSTTIQPVATAGSQPAL